ncbi:MAG: TRAP transporter small permease subunit [Deltaproteobacteria bacterium]|jgi:TRAP-type mannitol/chloroaromatic compound transport system permease small subunit|nr:TRAP transporter small permease subunit [Deltaproteobacteria bacterium]
MPNFVKLYVKYVDKMNRAVGRVTLYMVFVLMGILLFSALSRFFLNKPVIWGMEMAQFTMVIYFTIGGSFALLLNSHVRMDIIYSRWTFKRKARMDSFTFIFLLAYLGILLYGCVSSTVYSIEYNQHNNTAWAPPIAPVKILIGVGIILTMLQAVSEFFKDMARSKGLEIGEPVPELKLLEQADEEKSSREPVIPAPAPVPAPVPVVVSALPSYDYNNLP